MLAESMSPLRRIYTDGRDFPQGEADAAAELRRLLDRQMVRHSSNDGVYDTLEIETRYTQGPRLFDLERHPAAPGQPDGREGEALSRQGRPQHPAR